MTTPPPLPPSLIDVRGVLGFPGYIVGYDAIEANVWSCWKMGPGGLMTSTWRRLRPAPDSKGYLRYNLCRQGERHTCRLHQMVATAFLGPCPEGNVVCHGPRGKQCNLPWNLDYGTPSDNQVDRFRDGTHGLGECNPQSKLNRGKVKELFRLKLQGVSHGEIAARFDVSKGTIARISRGKLWGHLGLAPNRKRIV